MSFVRSGVSPRLVASDFQPSTAKVSSRSEFSDDIWRLDRFVAGKPRTTIHWGFDLSNGTRLTDRVNADWYFSAKLFMLILLKGGLTTGKELRAASVLAYFHSLRALMVWMSSRGCTAFSELTQRRLLAYRNSLRRMVDHGSISRKYRVHKLALVRLLVAARGQIPNGVAITPATFNELCGKDVAITPQMRVGSTEALSDEMFARLLNVSLEWVTEIAPVLFDLVDEFERFRLTATFRIHRNYAALYEAKSRRAPEVRTFSNSGLTLSINEIRAKTVTTYLNHLVTACHLIIAGMTGQRVSETLGLRKGCLKARRLADGRELLELHGTMFKTSLVQQGSPAIWIAGWEESDNPVRLAVQALERLSGRRCEATEDALLFVPVSERRNPADPGLQCGAVAYRIKQFLSLNGMKSWTLSSHQLRKNFARLVVFQFPTAVFAVARQFQHVSAQMMSRYLPSDPTILEDVMDAALDMGADRLDAILGSDKLGGIKGREIMARNMPYRGAAGARLRREVVKEVMDDPTIRVVMHVYGVCLYDDGPAACGGKLAKVGLTTCMSCKNFVTDKTHLPFWLELKRLWDANDNEYKSLGLSSSRSESLKAEIVQMCIALSAKSTSKKLGQRRKAS